MDKYLSIVNAKTPFNKDDFQDFQYITGIEVRLPDQGEVAFIEKETYDAYLELKAHLKKKKIPCSLNSAGRSIRAQELTQKEMFDIYLKKYENGHSHEEAVQLAQQEVEKSVMKPGNSEHHTGLAIDISPKLYSKNFITKLIARSYNKKHLDKNFQYIAEVAPQYGFIIRYTANNIKATGVQIPEPWHLRYVGKEHAQEIANRMKKDPSYSLEQYVAELTKLDNSNVSL